MRAASLVAALTVGGEGRGWLLKGVRTRDASGQDHEGGSGRWPDSAPAASRVNPEHRILGAAEGFCGVESGLEAGDKLWELSP